MLREFHGAELVERGAIILDSGTRPTGAAYNSARRLLAWTEESSTSIYLAGLTTPGRRIELRSDVSGLVPHRFFEDGNHLAAMSRAGGLLRIWNVETGQIDVSIDSLIREPAFAAGDRVLVACITKGQYYDIVFINLAHPDRAPQRVSIADEPQRLAVSPDGGLVALSSNRGLVRLFDPVRGELIETLHAHLNAAIGLAFSADGRRLISAFGGREAVKLWDVGTRQELLTLAGTGSTLGLGQLECRWGRDPSRLALASVAGFRPGRRLPRRRRATSQSSSSPEPESRRNRACRHIELEALAHTSSVRLSRFSDNGRWRSCRPSRSAN